jgi:hypothetical protein
VTQRTTTEIAADLVDYRAAKSALVKGERVTEVWRDGRRMIMASITLPQIEAAIDNLLREYEGATEVEAGRPARRPIGLRWRN